MTATVGGWVVSNGHLNSQRSSIVVRQCECKWYLRHELWTMWLAEVEVVAAQPLVLPVESIALCVQPSKSSKDLTWIDVHGFGYSTRLNSSRVALTRRYGIFPGISVQIRITSYTVPHIQSYTNIDYQQTYSRTPTQIQIHLIFCSEDISFYTFSETRARTFSERHCTMGFFPRKNMWERWIEYSILSWVKYVVISSWFHTAISIY